MVIHFHKYQATGNDFVLIDNRKINKSFTTKNIIRICDRRFGVGADGLILIEDAEGVDFKMIYYNKDGSQSFCGNGCRSAVNFASYLNLIDSTSSFLAYDGLHEASILADKNIRLKMNDIKTTKKINDDFFIDTGSPHYISFVPRLEEVDVVSQGKKIRYSDDFKPSGTNVNFVELLPNNTIAVRTYERGVEDETLSCGTGVTAAALAASYKGYHSPIKIEVQGGHLGVSFSAPRPQSLTEGRESEAFTNVFLIGPAKMVFEGDLEL